jgi:NADH-quinone oxidoreductase subunit E
MSTVETPASGVPAGTPPEFPQDLRDKIADMVAHEHHARGAAIEAMRLTQKRFGWLCDAHMREIAKLCSMSMADLDGIATFFNLLFRKPVGENVVMLCDSVSCWLMGEEKVRARFCEKLGIKRGQTTPDGKVTFLPIVCLGHCDHAPAMLVNEELYGNVDTETVDRVIDQMKNGSVRGES